MARRTLRVRASDAVPLRRVWCLYEMIVTVEEFERFKRQQLSLPSRAAGSGRVRYGGVCGGCGGGPDGRGITQLGV